MAATALVRLLRRNEKLAAGTFIAYQANQYLSFELGYEWLGLIAYTGKYK